MTVHGRKAAHQEKQKQWKAKALCTPVVLWRQLKGTFGNPSESCRENEREREGERDREKNSEKEGECEREREVGMCMVVQSVMSL